MIGRLRHLLSPAYLYAQEPAPLGSPGAAQVVWALALVLLALWAGRRARAGSPWAGATTVGALAAVALVLVRPLVAGPLSARVWSLSATALAVGCAAASLVGGSEWVRGLGESLPRAPWPIAAALYSAGVVVLVAWGQGGWWPAGVGVAALVIASLGAKSRRPRPEVLAPLAVAGVFVGLGRLVGDGLGVDLAAYQAFPYPDPVSPWFSPSALALAGAAGTGLLALRRTYGRRASALAGLGLAAVGAGAFLWTAIAHLPAGVTASDPYCYLQMAADLVERGTPLHPFPLATWAGEAGLPTWPAVHVGYHPPAAGEWAPTVWPIGWPLLLAPLYALGGEAAAHWGAPLWLLGAGVLTGLLAAEGRSGTQRVLAGGLAAFLVLTSAEAILRSLLPLADAAAMALAALTLFCLMRSTRATTSRRALAWAAAGGVALGLDYWVRHPQAPLALASLGLLAAPGQARGRRWGALAACAGGALLAVLPDLAYHRGVFGSVWAMESPEAHLLALGNIPRTAGPMLAEVLGRREFGYVAPLMAWGLWGIWRRWEDRPLALATTFGFVGVLLFNLSYAAVRLRDLLPLLPILALWTGWGAASAARRLAVLGSARATVGAALLLMAFAARSAWALGLPASGDIPAFGRLTAGEVGELQRLGEALPEDAVVLASLHSGAVERYAGRPTLRPASWGEEDLVRALAALWEDGRPTYLLVDGEETRDDLLPRLEAVALLTPQGSIAIPVLGRDGSEVGRGVVVYAVGATRAPVE